MYDHLKCFDSLPVKIQLEHELYVPSILLGFFEQFRKFYNMQEYPEVAKMYRCTKLVEDQNASLEVFFMAVPPLKLITMATLPAKSQTFGQKA